MCGGGERPKAEGRCARMKWSRSAAVTQQREARADGCMLDGRVCRKPELSHLGRQLDAPAKTDQAVHQRPTCPRLHDRVLQNLQQG